MEEKAERKAQGFSLEVIGGDEGDVGRVREKFSIVLESV